MGEREREEYREGRKTKTELRKGRKKGKINIVLQRKPLLMSLSCRPP